MKIMKLFLALCVMAFFTMCEAAPATASTHKDYGYFSQSVSSYHGDAGIVKPGFLEPVAVFRQKEWADNQRNHDQVNLTYRSYDQQYLREMPFIPGYKDRPAW